MIPESEQRPKQIGKLTGFSAASVTRWIEDGAALRHGGRLKLRAGGIPPDGAQLKQWVRFHQRVDG